MKPNADFVNLNASWGSFLVLIKLFAKIEHFGGMLKIFIANEAANTIFGGVEIISIKTKTMQQSRKT